jgi:hypothetical protein
MPLVSGESSPPSKPDAVGVEPFGQVLQVDDRAVEVCLRVDGIRAAPGITRLLAVVVRPARRPLPRRRSGCHPCGGAAIVSVWSFHWLAQAPVLYWQLPMTSALS